jgi:tetratricopeptide (TPR) repeat protein
VSRLALVLLVGAMAACGGSARRAAKGPARAERVANPAAVAKLAQGAAAAREPGGQARAAELFRQALALDGTLWEARYDLGLVLAARGELDEAGIQLARAAREAPGEEAVVVALAEVERRRGRAKEGADALAAFVKAHPNAAHAKGAYVGALREARRFDPALEQARELLALHPGDPGALAELALCHLAKGEHETASLVAKQAVDASTKDARPGKPDPEQQKKAEKAQLAAALVAFTRGNDAEAFAAFQKAAELDPSDPTPKLNVAAIYLRAGQYAKAEAELRSVLAQSRDDVDALVALAVAQRGQGTPDNPAKWNEAKATLDRVLALDKDNPAAHYNLGVLYMSFLKKPAEAKAAFAAFVREAPSSHPKLADAKKSLSELDATAKGSAK